MGVDTKSGPAIHGQLAENGYEDIASAILPAWQCNAPAEIRGSLKIEMPDATDQSALRISGSGEVPDTTPDLNPRGPSGFDGHQFPVAGEPYLTLPGGSGTGTDYGNNIGVAQSPQFGSPDPGDFSVNSSGGFDTNPSMGGQPPGSLSSGAMDNGEQRKFEFNPPDVEVGGGVGGGGGGGAQDGRDGKDGRDANVDPCDIANLVCDMMLEGNLCVDGEIRGKDGVASSVRWATVDDIIGPDITGYVTLIGTPEAARVNADGVVQLEPGEEPAPADGENAGNGGNGAQEAQDAEDEDRDKPECPRDGEEQDQAQAEGEPVEENAPDPPGSSVQPRPTPRPGEDSAATTYGEKGPGMDRGSATFTVERESEKYDSNNNFEKYDSRIQ